MLGLLTVAAPEAACVTLAAVSTKVVLSAPVALTGVTASRPLVVATVTLVGSPA